MRKILAVSRPQENTLSTAASLRQIQSFFLLCLLAGLSKLFCDTISHIFPSSDISNYLRREPLEPVVRLSAPRGDCTAFKVEEDLGIHFGISQPTRDYWLTARHCCLEADSVMSLEIPGKSIPVKKFLDDPISDYCILDTQKTAIQGLTLGTFQPAFPASDFEVWSLERRTPIHINSTFFLDDKRMQIGLDYPGKPGESGEPLLWNNQVVGLTSGGREEICFFSLLSGIRDVSFNRNYQNIFFNTPFYRKKASYHRYSITNEGAHRATKIEIEENIFLGWTLSPERIRSAKERTQTFSDVIWTYKNSVGYPNGIETAEFKRSDKHPDGNFTYLDWRFDQHTQQTSAALFYQDLSNGAKFEFYKYKIDSSGTETAEVKFSVNQPQGNFTYFNWKLDSQLVSAEFLYEDFPNGATLKYYQYKKYLNNTCSAQSLHYLGTNGEDFLHNHWESDNFGTNGAETSQKTEVREQGKIKFIHKHWAQDPSGIQTALQTEEFEPDETKLIHTNWIQYANGTQSAAHTQRELLAPIEEQGILPGDATVSPTTRSY